MMELTDEYMTYLRDNLSLCNPLVQSLVARLDRVEGEAGKLLAEADAEYNSRTNHLIERHAAQIEYLQQRIRDLTQRDPSWYDASPADAFMLLKKAQERIKGMGAALQPFAKAAEVATVPGTLPPDKVVLWCQQSSTEGTVGAITVADCRAAQAALKEGE